MYSLVTLAILLMYGQLKNTSNGTEHIPQGEHENTMLLLANLCALRGNHIGTTETDKANASNR